MNFTAAGTAVICRVACRPGPGRLLLQILGPVEDRSPAEGAVVRVCQLVARIAEDAVATRPIGPRCLTCVASNAQGVVVQAQFPGIDPVCEQTVPLEKACVLVLQGSVIRRQCREADGELAVLLCHVAYLPCEREPAARRKQGLDSRQVVDHHTVLFGE